ncbi:Hypothetical predicted protein, partial [Marmota monax]
MLKFRREERKLSAAARNPGESPGLRAARASPGMATPPSLAAGRSESDEWL